jgi:broad specificity phosphatase PhoE
MALREKFLLFNNYGICMNHLAGLIKLKNRYFIMRHGQSKANEQNIVLSNPALGTKGFGLTEHGKKQVEETIKSNKTLDKNTIIYSSDFTRARETAKIVRRTIKARPAQITKKLRERYFGSFDQRHGSVIYHEVWKHDEQNPDHKRKGIESANEVLDRTTSLVLELERKYSGKKILLVSHGDPLQILITGFMKQCPSSHRDIKHLEVAEIRELKLKK